VAKATNDVGNVASNTTTPHLAKRSLILIHKVHLSKLPNAVLNKTFLLDS
jgi:hypothetical protein